MPVAAGKGRVGLVAKKVGTHYKSLVGRGGQAMWICIGKRNAQESEALKTTSLLPQH